ncbi:MAG: glycosyltransferase [Gemmatimonadaceae bacterium]
MESSLRILYDARSVRTAAGRYVLLGLTIGWRSDPRVSEVFVAVRGDFDHASLPAGINPLVLRDAGWIGHVRTVLPQLTRSARADIIFSPNGFPPRDPRAVVYFQDLYHFRLWSSGELSLRDRTGNIMRALWRGFALPKCMLAVSTSSQIEQEVTRRVPIPVRMIPNGVDIGSMRWTGGDDMVFVMGGTGARKSEALALRAWASLDFSRAASNTRLEIAGVEPAARRVQLCALTESLGISRSVRITGAISRDDFLERIARCRVAISCSTLEAFGLPVAEALALGAPVLATDIPSHVELIQRAGAGETFPVNDHTALAERLCRTLAGGSPSRLAEPPVGWSWEDRAREHIDAYSLYA